MHVLFLGYSESKLIAFLRQEGCVVTHTDRHLPTESFDLKSFNLLISFGYRYIIPASILQHFEGRSFNLHISLLPWNRGAHPNFWSLFEGTPCGVSIHHLDAGIDTGSIAFQKEVQFDSFSETLHTTHRKLVDVVEQLFCEQWCSFKTGSVPELPQNGIGSFHRKRDIDSFFPMLSNGWDTPVAEVMRIGRMYRKK